MTSSRWLLPEQLRRRLLVFCAALAMPTPCRTSLRLSQTLMQRRTLPHTGEALIGARAFRVVFAGISLPLALAAVVHFINHRYSGTPLWNLRDTPGVHAAVWGLSLVSFFFLYPSTFNLLEVRSVYLLRTRVQSLQSVSLGSASSASLAVCGRSWRCSL